MDLIWSYKIS